MTTRRTLSTGITTQWFSGLSRATSMSVKATEMGSKATRMNCRTISERVSGKATNARSSKDAKSWMFATSSCEVLRETYSFFRNEQSSYKRTQQCYESERECRGRVRHDIESSVVHSGPKLNLEKSCEARNGDERTSSSHVNLERRNCWSESVKTESDSQFECRCVKDQSVMIILVTRAWELESRRAVVTPVFCPSPQCLIQFAVWCSLLSQTVAVAVAFSQFSDMSQTLDTRKY